MCALNCKGCYVKEWGKNTEIISMSAHLPSFIWERFIYKMSGMITENFQANQITFALDTLPSDLAIKTYMKDLAYIYMDVAKGAKYQGLDTEFHITTQSLNNIFNQTSYHCLDNLGSIDMLSISNLNQKDIVNLINLKDRYPDLHINWNLHPIEIRDESTYKQIVSEIAVIAKFVDSIYFVMHKPDLGRMLDQDIVRQYFKLFKIIKETLQNDTKIKDPNMIQIDGCVKDSKMFADEVNGGCSSNISRFQVWPDGSVSGCPYAHRPITKSCWDDDPILELGDDIVENMLNNIRAAAKIYQFDQCKIPNSLYPDSTPVLRREHRALQIFED